MKFNLICFLLLLILPVSDGFAQSDSEIHIEGSTNLDNEISQLMNDLNLSNDQKIIVGLLVLKYGTSFDYKEFESASKARQYAMAKKTIKEIDKELKDVLDKKQYKIYKKRKKAIKKELMKMA